MNLKHNKTVWNNSVVYAWMIVWMNKCSLSFSTKTHLNSQLKIPVEFWIIYLTSVSCSFISSIAVKRKSETSSKTQNIIFSYLLRAYDKSHHTSLQEKKENLNATSANTRLPFRTSKNTHYLSLTTRLTPEGMTSFCFIRVVNTI